ncbi:MAG: hypothetical protein Q4B43_04650 [Bacteroidota bacterium]|nr:hypothetical protein [Bacteroidota bacterium]
MIRRIIQSVTLTIGICAFAQQNSSSPYSYFGTGEQFFRGSIEHKSMGGIGVFPDSIHLNLANPASYGDLKLTVISAGMKTTINKMSSDTQHQTTNRYAVDYVAVGIPIGKFGVAFGINPQTSVGYKIRTAEGTTLNSSTGEGGENRVFLGLGYQILPNLSIGIEGNYGFGNILTENRLFLSTSPYSTLINNNMHISAFSYNLGVMYTHQFGKDYKLFTSLTYRPSYNMDIKREKKASVMHATLTGQNTDEVIIFPETKETYSMPNRYSFGLGLGKFRKWAFAAEYVHTAKSPFDTPISQGDSNFINKEATRLSIGGYYVPKFNSFSNYFERVTYRFGVRMETTGLVINNQEIKDNAISIGANFPIGRSFSDMAIQLEYGQRGTQKANLIKEDYFNISLGFSISDKWFRKLLFE